MARPRKDDRTQIRSERISLIVTPAILAGASTLAAIKGVSVNDFLATLIESIVKKNATVIEEFDEARRRASAAVRLDVDTDTD